MRTRGLVGGFFLTAVGLAWLGWFFQRARTDLGELRRAAQEVAEGRVASATTRLLDLSRRHPNWDEVHYQLGLCEEARGRVRAALACWDLVAPGAPVARKATIARARVYTNTGQFSRAEAVLLSLPRGQDDDSNLVRQAIELLYRIEGRTHEVHSLVLESWADSLDPGYTLRRLYLLDDSAFPIEHARRATERGAPDDDRVWIGRANLALWSGRRDEARRWLEACLHLRPDDPAVWSAFLELSRVEHDVDGVRRALDHLPPSWFTRSERLRLRGWLAARIGDRDLERREWLALVEQEPGDASAWDRLSILALESGRRDEAEALRRTKARMSALRKRYVLINKEETRNQHAAELAQLAAQLGRKLEARGWELIAEGRAPREPLPVEVEAVAIGPTVQTAADLVADLLARLPTSRSPASPSQGDAAGIAFTDRAGAAKLTFFHENGQSGKNPPPPEPMCGGVGLLDYDGDGRLDIYAVQGGPFPPSSSPGMGDRLFRNRGDGTFDDVTDRSRIGSFPGGYGHGVAVADFDNDGHPDLFVTRWRSYALYRNRGDGTFDDVTDRAGLGGDRDWPTSAAFADLDNDGDLDLYVCHYLRYDPSNPKRCEHPESPNDRTCYPLDFPSLPDHLFRNDGGRFIDVTREAGIDDHGGRGLGVVAADLDRDGKIDLFVANDMTVNNLFRNLGGFRFEEIGDLAGVACAADGNYRAGMGIACGDLDGDGLPDLAVTNYFGESTTFYQNTGGGLFVDRTNAVGLAGPSRPLLGFGAAFLDADNDGQLDLLTVNGHVVDNRPRFPWMMPMQLLRGKPGGHLEDISSRSGEPFVAKHLGRGLAIGDLDDDGRIDAVVLAQNEPLIYLHNDGQAIGHAIVFELQGTRSNRDAVGARVSVSAGGRVRVADRIGGGSYQSAAGPRLNFGLGELARADSVEVRWPSGQVDRIGPLDAGAAYRIVEGSGRAVRVSRRNRPGSAR